MQAHSATGTHYTLQKVWVWRVLRPLWASKSTDGQTNGRHYDNNSCSYNVCSTNVGYDRLIKTGGHMNDSRYIPKRSYQCVPVREASIPQHQSWRAAAV